MEKETRTYKAHVLVLPYPTQGHLNPMLQFSKRLISKGLKATLAATIFVFNSKNALDPPCNSIDVETISDGHDTCGRAGAKSIKYYLTTFQEIGSRTLADLIIRLRDSGRPVDALVYDSFLPWALDVAKRFGLVGAVFFTQSCAVNSIYYHVHKGLLQLPLPGPKFSLPGLPSLEPFEAPSFVYAPESYPAFYDMVVDQFYNIDEADWVLYNTFYELEKEVVEWMEKLWPLRTIGPTIPSMYLDQRLENDQDYSINLFKPNNGACMRWLKAKPKGSVIYVSFGSLAALEEEQMIELAWGLKGTKYCFLWIVRAQEEDKLPNKFKEEISDKGLLMSWCSQLQVLAHESVGCFVTHCGFNSTLEALSLGIPVVAMPQWTDQSTNAKYVEDVWEVGKRARPDEKGLVKREVIELCIREVMEERKGKQMKKNAIKWRDLAKDAVSEGGSSDNNIDEFVSKLSASSKRHTKL